MEATQSMMPSAVIRIEPRNGWILNCNPPAFLRFLTDASMRLNAGSYGSRVELLHFYRLIRVM